MQGPGPLAISKRVGDADDTVNRLCREAAVVGSSVPVGDEELCGCVSQTTRIVLNQVQVVMCSPLPGRIGVADMLLVCLSIGSCLAGLLLGASPALAFDKMSCVRAHESAQTLRKSGQLPESRQQLVICASVSCPGLVQEDCRLWLGELDRALEPPPVDGKVDPVAVEPVAGPSSLPEESHGAQPTGASGRLQAPGEPESPPVGTVTSPGGAVAKDEVHTPTQAPIERARAELSIDPSWRGPILLGSAAALVLATGAYLGWTGRSSSNELRDTCAPACDPAEVSTIRKRLELADLALLTGVIGAGATAWLIWDRSRSYDLATTRHDGLGASVAAGALRVHYSGHF